MATADKTKQRLMASMRKSKTGPATKRKTATAARSTGTAKKAVPKRAATQRSAPRRARGTADAAAITAVTQQSSNDPYQSNGRIWPD